MERLSRKERRAVQSERDRRRRQKVCPVEFAWCGACDYLIKVYRGEDGPTKPCPRCGWNRHRMGVSWEWRALVNTGDSFTQFPKGTQVAE